MSDDPGDAAHRFVNPTSAPGPGPAPTDTGGGEPPGPGPARTDTGGGEPPGAGPAGRPGRSAGSDRAGAATATRARPVRRPLREDQASPRPAPELISRRDRRRVRIVERFTGKRVHNRVGIWRRVRSLVYLILLAAILAAVLAAVLAAIIAGLSVVFRHASGS